MDEWEINEKKRARECLREVTIARFDGRFYEPFWMRLADALEADLWRDHPHILAPTPAND